jgi:hypothetical protein
MKRIRLLIILTTIGGLYSCKPKIEAPEAAMGDVDASKFIAIGTNNTGGYSNDALNYTGQQNNYAAILAKQFSMVTEIEFKQPLISAASIGINTMGQSALKLDYKTDCKGVTSLSPVRIGASGDLAQFGSIAGQGPFNNLGFPEFSAINLNTTGYGNSANGAGNYNAYYSRFASNVATASVLSDALAQNPTFFTFMVGDFDILKYAKSGGTSGPIPPSFGSDGIGFDGSVNAAISALTGNGARGVIANIPDVTKYPFFNTIPYNGLTLDADKAQTMNAIYNPIGISFVVGANPFTIDDPSQPFGVRKMVEGELVLLSVPLDSVKCFGMGSAFPLRDEFVLTLDEIAELQLKMNQYNSILSATTQTYGLAFANVKLLMENLKKGLVYNGVSMSSTFVSGGVFSLDGIQLNPNGQALLANLFIESINNRYQARIPFANVNAYSGIIFP